jgi:hypothetical protein
MLIKIYAKGSGDETRYSSPAQCIEEVVSLLD